MSFAKDESTAATRSVMIDVSTGSAKSVRKIVVVVDKATSPSQAVLRMLSKLLMVGLAILSTGPANSQPPVKIEDRLSDPVYLAWTSEPTVAACVTCHLNDKGTAFSRQREMRDWIDKDKHAIARQRVEPFSPAGQEAELIKLFTRLNTIANKRAADEAEKGYTIDTNEIGLTKVPEEWIGSSNLLSRRICDKLWGEGHVETKAGYEDFRKACLACHGGVTERQTASTESLADYPVGIDCLYCHQDGKQDAWQKLHLNESQWRLSSPEKKKSLGMADMVNTANQASLCLDCHVGNHDKNMFVTHPMYAAGHPPLPSIEVQTFSERMPMHWQSPAQLHENMDGDPTRDEYFATNYPGVVDAGPDQVGKTFFDTRNLFIGALTARRKAVQLMVQLSLTEDWGDYALYDCAACHHELQSESRRQQRTLTSDRPSVPGRPRQHEWQSVLLDVAYRLGGKEAYADVSRLESRLQDCFDDKPFGSADAVRSVGGDLVRAIDRTINIVSGRTFEAPLTMAVLKLTCETEASQLLTYDAARQVVWAVNVMTDELRRKDVSISVATDAALVRLNDVSATGLDVAIPAGRGQFIYPDYLGKTFKQRAEFEPDRLAEILDELRSTLMVQRGD